LARELGIEALRVPSATSKGDNIVLFVENLGPGASIAVQEVTEAWPEEAD
jgi:hypothetical protein